MAGVGATTGTGGGNGGIAEPLPLEQLGDAYLEILCSVYIECLDAVFRDIEHCKADSIAYGLDDVLAGVQEGRISYDPAAIGQCKQVIERNICTFGSFFLLTPEVPQVLDICTVGAGNQAAGQPCRNHLECEQGLYCAMQDWACPGVCTAYQQEGEYCAVGSEYDCDPGPPLTLVEFFEILDTDPSQLEQLSHEGLECAENACRADAALGQPCVLNQDCINGWCDDSGSARCEPFRQANEACSGFSECADELWCDLPVLGGTGTCRPIGGIGDACEFDSHCQDGLWCSRPGAENGQCQALSQQGGPCEGSSGCAEGFGCDGGTCGPLPGAGLPCVFGECSPGLMCNDADVCATPRLPGESCSDTNTVCVRSICRNSQCTLRASLGAACVENDDCASRDCVEMVCIDDDLCQYSAL
jgi:hypothetical protein